MKKKKSEKHDISHKILTVIGKGRSLSHLKVVSSSGRSSYVKEVTTSHSFPKELDKPHVVRTKESVDTILKFSGDKFLYSLSYRGLSGYEKHYETSDSPCYGAPPEQRDELWNGIPWYSPMSLV
ncbi:hypothetical protein NPIL_212751 [Nephila pilipes]|uniref:Uncharacterized protein n=1 Tax=Nephila pilipes TaxID=299642 RepID=A0A8X6IRM1_NEPPI|nr:hypothetical protein NPIL_212751 [Nephila pilipes]